MFLSPIFLDEEVTASELVFQGVLFHVERLQLRTDSWLMLLNNSVGCLIN
jgi:hypothetical protein